MTQGVLSHFGIGWRTFKSHPRVFVLSMLTLLGSWVVLEVGVISLQRFGIVVWLVLHLAFFFFLSGLMVGLHRIALAIVDGQTPGLADVTASLDRGPTLLLAFCVYFAGTIAGLVLFVVPGIIVAVRYAFFGQTVAATSASALEALGAAAGLSEGRRWSLGVFFLLVLLLNLAGLAFLGVGFFITFPVTLLATASLYRSLRQESAQ